MQKKTNKASKLILGLFLFVILAGFVSADSYQLYCVPPGQTVNLATLCNPAMPPRDGPVTLCMHLQDNGKICPASINVCNSLHLTCTSNANTTIDTVPPTFDILSPVNNAVYTEKALLLNIVASEVSDIYFIDNVNNPGVWTRVCKDCRTFSKKRGFEEGVNDLLFRARDRSGNEAFKNHTFFIDTKIPQIKSLKPEEGFTSGLFKVEFLEANPKNLTIKYGNDLSGMRNLKVNLSTCIDGTSSRKICEVQANLTHFDNEQIEIWAELTDIAGNLVVSEHNYLEVDFSDPIIEDLDANVDGKYVNFRIELDESHPGNIKYRDNGDARPVWKNLCSKMNSEICEKKVSFKDGEHEVDLMITDEAGNSIETNVSFFTDSKKPKIKKTSPKSGFTSGEFEVEFDEANPDELILNYGNSLTGMREIELDIESDCIFDKTYKCDKHVNVADYNGEEIEYYFTLSDRVGQNTESRHTQLDVDNIFPVIESITHTLNGNKALVMIEVTETNLDEITYLNNADTLPKERIFCASLSGGMCKKTILLRPGANEINFQVYDEAGNSVGQGYEISL